MAIQYDAQEYLNYISKIEEFGRTAQENVLATGTGYLGVLGTSRGISAASQGVGALRSGQKGIAVLKAGTALLGITSKSNPFTAIASLAAIPLATIYEESKVRENPEKLIEVAQERVDFLRELRTIFKDELSKENPKELSVLMDELAQSDNPAQRELGERMLARYADIQERFAKASGENMLTGLATGGLKDFADQGKRFLTEKLGGVGSVLGTAGQSFATVFDFVTENVSKMTRGVARLYANFKGTENTLDELLAKHPDAIYSKYSTIDDLDKVYDEKKIGFSLAGAYVANESKGATFTNKEIDLIVKDAKILFSDPKGASINSTEINNGGVRELNNEGIELWRKISSLFKVNTYMPKDGTEMSVENKPSMNRPNMAMG